MISRIIIIGGGIIGSLTGLALSKLYTEIIIIEQNSSQILDDGRNFAISGESIKFLEYINLWPELKNFATPIKQVKVIKDKSDVSVNFELDSQNEMMGYMVKSNNLLRILRNKLEKNDKVRILWQEKCDNILNNSENIIVSLESGKSIETDFIVIAEGKFSNMRKNLGIKTNIIDHKQVALTFNILHDNFHDFIAVENFFISGPIASLPLSNMNESSIIWMVKSQLKNLLLSWSKEEIASYLQDKIGDRLGKIRIISEIKSFDLQTIYANKYYHGKSLLIGDAAHSIHPIAGQGLNLGIRDVKFLEKILREEFSSKNFVNYEEILQKYEKIRKKDGNAMIMVTSLCNELFLSRSGLIRTGIELGIKILEKSPYLKGIFLRYAKGVRAN